MFLLSHENLQEVMNSGYISETESKHMVNILLQALIYLLDFYYIVDSLNQGIVILSFTVARIKKFIEIFLHFLLAT